jgi:hypothetical protein
MGISMERPKHQVRRSKSSKLTTPARQRRALRMSHGMRKIRLLSFLLNSMTKEVLRQVATEASAVGAWRAILRMFSSQSRAHVVHLCSKLSSTRKGDMNYDTYYSLMKGFMDEMVAAGKRLDDEDVICYILIGLDFEYNPFVEAFTSKTEAQTLNDLYSQLLMVEARVEA